MLFSGIVDLATLNLMANMGLANMKIIFYNTAGTYTYTPSPNLLFAEVECIGGGANYSPPTLSSSQAGGYARSIINATAIGTSQQVIVGATSAPGNPSKFGTIVQGDGGQFQPTSTSQSNVGQFTVTGQFWCGASGTGSGSYTFGGASFYGYPQIVKNLPPYLGGGSKRGSSSGGGCVIITEFIGG